MSSVYYAVRTESLNVFEFLVVISQVHEYSNNTYLLSTRSLHRG